MTRLLLRAPKTPFEARSATQTLEGNLIAGNSGNLVFIDASWKLLAAPGVEIEPDRLAVGPSDADRINERYDAYVVPLANAFRGSFEHNLARMTALVRRLRIPVVVLGVGAQGTPDYDFGALAPMERSVRDFVSAVLDRAPSIGVRGEGTAAYLRSLGYGDDLVDVIGCPSLFLRGTDLRVQKRAPTLGRESLVAVTISPYRGAMAPIVATALERYPRLVYVAQDTPTLELLVDGAPFPGSTPDAALPTHPAHRLFREDRTRLYLDPWPWIEGLRPFDYSFGTRIHGSIVALLAGVPATVLVHDSRTLELARYFGIPYRLLRDLARDTDPAELYADADLGSLNEGHAARFDTLTAFLAKHGLDHAFAHPGAPEAFDARVAAVTFPPAVTVSSEAGAGGLGRRVRRLRLAAKRALSGKRVRRVRTAIARRR
jgi:hypothetical protein